MTGVIFRWTAGPENIPSLGSPSLLQPKDASKFTMIVLAVFITKGISWTGTNISKCERQPGWQNMLVIGDPHPKTWLNNVEHKTCLNQWTEHYFNSFSCPIFIPFNRHFLSSYLWHCPFHLEQTGCAHFIMWDLRFIGPIFFWNSGEVKLRTFTLLLQQFEFPANFGFLHRRQHARCKPKMSSWDHATWVCTALRLIRFLDIRERMYIT